MEPERASFPLSALQHYAFCPRQCALIHVERLWAENTLTAEGRVLHDRAHEAGHESRGGLRIARGLALQSTRLGFHGVADVVEFHRQPDGSWRPFPIEYKRGRPKHSSIDSVQLCAQALCLEEMLATAVAAGALFYGKTHRRHDVDFSSELRRETQLLAEQVHALLASGRTPAAEYTARCHSCSLFELCRPKAASRSAAAYVARLLEARD